MKYHFDIKFDYTCFKYIQDIKFGVTDHPLPTTLKSPHSSKYFQEMRDILSSFSNLSCVFSARVFSA